MRARESAAPARRRRIVVMLLAGLAVLTGCVEIDGELAADGSLAFRYKYDPPPHATFKSETARLASAHVRVEKIERDPAIVAGTPSEFAIATLAVDDARQLATSAAFARAQVGLDHEKRTLRVTFPGVPAAGQEKVRNTPEADRQALRLSLVFPGPVTEATPSATIEGRRVTWVLTTRQYAALGDPAVLTASWNP
jgi:hypothetical protein